MVSKMRTRRIADRIREELSTLLLMEVKDPRVAGATITDVEVDRELAFANVYVSCVEGSQRAEEILEGLNHAGGFLRSALAQRIQLRVFPRLRFHWDPTPEQADHMERLFAQLRAERQGQTESAEGESASEEQRPASPQEGDSPVV
ncbi:MAG TPA: 30S ribosome-binding factor RbfA [Chloroflexi bacterium]|nr:30S ribosome-binding factor RbfA [Chloroflexota bacterium]